MNFKKLKIEQSYDKNKKGVDVLNDFYIPVLEQSVQYDRIGSYFRSSVFIANAKGVVAFIANGGVIRLIGDIALLEKDVEAINRGEDGSINESQIEEYFKDEISRIKEKIYDNRFEFLSYLIASNKLQIRIAVVEGSNEHSKLGIFKDKNDNIISFLGSINESFTGWGPQGNKIPVFRSWIEESRIKDDIETFETMWNNKGQITKVYNFPKAVKEDLIKSIPFDVKDENATKKYLRKKTEEERKPDFARIQRVIKPSLPNFIDELFEYQEEAYENWIQNKMVGFFKMATGTGKTITALNCALELYKAEGKVIGVVLAPTISLCSQWVEEIESFNFQNIQIANSKDADWQSKVFKLINKSVILDRSIFIVSTYATFNMDKFQSILKKLPSNTLLIADEAHNFGSEQNIEKMPKHIERRIGLSATPDRYFDDEGTKNIISYFGCSDDNYTQEINMKTAIDNDYLSGYYYYPRIVELTEDEMEDYEKISKRILYHYGNNSSSLDHADNSLQKLLLQRKRIMHKAYYKKDVFRQILTELTSENSNLKYLLVFVPEGRNSAYESDYENLINEYSNIIDSEFGLKQHQFIGLTKNRHEVIKDFTDGKISVITAMKCLDEGIDIKRAEFGIFLSSTGNPRQFIQRRGRLLRKHRKKRNAKIYDLIVVPKLSEFDDEIKSLEKNIIKSELRRVFDFANTALNKYHALESLSGTLELYDIDIYDLKGKELEI